MLYAFGWSTEWAIDKIFSDAKIIIDLNTFSATLFKSGTAAAVKWKERHKRAKSMFIVKRTSSVKQSHDSLLFTITEYNNDGKIRPGSSPVSRMTNF